MAFTYAYFHNKHQRFGDRQVEGRDINYRAQRGRKAGREEQSKIPWIWVKEGEMSGGITKGDRQRTRSASDKQTGNYNGKKYLQSSTLVSTHKIKTVFNFGLRKEESRTPPRQLTADSPR